MKTKRRIFLIIDENMVQKQAKFSHGMELIESEIDRVEKEMINSFPVIYEWIENAIKKAIKNSVVKH